jgi:hypothetical protein
MNEIIEIANPEGRRYTSVKKAHEYIARGRAYMADGMLVILNHACQRMSFEDVEFWNGSPKPKIMQKINIRRVLDKDCGPVIPMHRPGEIRS